MASEKPQATSPDNPDSCLPDRMLFQWHITELCNLGCSHCYQDGDHLPEPSWDELMLVLEEFRSFTLYCRRQSGVQGFKAHITVTGGEPFLRPDFIDLLKRISEDEGRFSFAVLTNGTLLTAEIVRSLAMLKPGFVQVSIDGCRQTHDLIRGTGSYDRAVDGIKMLVRERISTHISFTANRENFRDFPDVAALGLRLGVSRVWSDRMVPCGSALAGHERHMTPDETREYVGLMHKEGGRRFLRRSPVSLIRSLQFTATGERPYRCSAGDTLVTVLPNGDVCPCRRMPVVVGNILNERLKDIYASNSLFRDLRDRQRVSIGCEGCFYSENCGGGARCISSAVHGDPFRADPGCWLAAKGHAMDFGTKTRLNNAP